MIDFLVKIFVRDTEDIHSPQTRQRYGVLAGGVGIFCNLLLFLGKLAAGLLTSSISITADAYNNLSDAGSSVITLVGFRLAGIRADKNHPFGHGRMEYLSGLAVAMAILLVGIELIKTSVDRILHPEEITFSTLSLVILVVSIGVKLWMGWFNRSLSRRIDSAAMAATAADSFSDAAATAAVLLGMVAGHLFDLRIDGWMGLLVALFILRAGWEAAKDTVDPLLGQEPDQELVREIRDTVLRHPQIVGLHDMVIHDYGPGRRMMSLHAEVPVGADIMEIHDVVDAIEREIQQKFGIETSIHTDPIATQDPFTIRLRGQVAELAGEVDRAMTIHDFRITRGPDHINLIFDVVVPYQCTRTDEEVRRLLEERLKELDPRYYGVIQVDRSYVEVPET